MKNEGKIRHKFKQAKFRHYQKRLRSVSGRVPCNCTYNLEIECTGKTVGICQYRGENWGVVVCDGETEEGLEQASGCPVFTPMMTEEEIKLEIDDILSTKDIALIAYHFPDLAALLWVLDNFEEADGWLEVEKDEGGGDEESG